MANTKRNKGAKRDSPEPREGGATSGRTPTSRNREESMKESGQDEFQNPRSSGTTPLVGEDPDSESAMKEEL